MHRFIFAVLIAIVGASGASDAQLRVATSFSILEDLVRNVGGNRVSITNFVPRDGDSHTYQPSTQDVKNLSGCRAVFVNGLGLEAWFGKLLKNSGSAARVVTLSDGLKTRRLEAGEEAGGTDPHLWWNPLNTIQYVNRIRDTLVGLDPAGKALYTSNAARYTRELTALDAWARLETQKLPAAQRLLVTNHDALGYFAARYGFQIIGNVIPSFGTESEPSARDTARLIDTMRRLGVRAIFSENTVPPKLASRIAEESGARVAEALYTDALGQRGSSGDTYLRAFRYNVTTIVAALR